MKNGKKQRSRSGDFKSRSGRTYHLGAAKPLRVASGGVASFFSIVYHAHPIAPAAAPVSHTVLRRRYLGILCSQLALRRYGEEERSDTSSCCYCHYHHPVSASDHHHHHHHHHHEVVSQHTRSTYI